MKPNPRDQRGHVHKRSNQKEKAESTLDLIFEIGVPDKGQFPAALAFLIEKVID